LTPEQRQAVYHAWLKAPGHFNEIDLIRMAEEATLADRERQAGEAVAWPAELSSISRTQPVRFNVIYRDGGEPVIDDDDFKFDALIKVHGDFDKGEKEKYVAEVCRRLNGVASLPAPQAVQAVPQSLIDAVLRWHDPKGDSMGACANLNKEIANWLAAAPSPDGKAEQAEAPSEHDFDAWHCERCDGTGEHWQEEQVGERLSDKQTIKVDCQKCGCLGWEGPDAQKAYDAQERAKLAHKEKS